MAERSAGGGSQAPAASVDRREGPPDDGGVPGLQSTPPIDWAKDVPRWPRPPRPAGLLVAIVVIVALVAWAWLAG